MVKCDWDSKSPPELLVIMSSSQPGDKARYFCNDECADKWWHQLARDLAPFYNGARCDVNLPVCI